MQEIAKAIEDKRVLVDAVKEWHSWVCREEHFNLERHKESEQMLLEAWKTNHADVKHAKLCALPRYLQRPTHTRTMWDTDAVEEDIAKAEGKQFCSSYFADAQGVFSRVHHHWHPGGQPLTNCLTKEHKGRRKRLGVKKFSGACKHGFPKTSLINIRTRVVCPGIARELRDAGVRVRGRRNALGAILGRRDDAWLSGAAPAFAVVFRSNTHTAPNVRLPLVPAVHEPGCTCKAWCSPDATSPESEAKLLRRIQLAAQRAMRNATRYFGGYMAKVPTVGRTIRQMAENACHNLRASMDGVEACRKVRKAVFRCTWMSKTKKGLLRPYLFAGPSFTPWTSRKLRSDQW